MKTGDAVDFNRAGNRLPLTNRVGDATVHFLVHGVTGGFPSNRQTLEDRYPTGDQRPQSTGGPSQIGFLQQFTEDRCFQQVEVPTHPPRTEFTNQGHKQEAGDRDQGEQEPEFNHTIGDRDQQLGRDGQVDFKFLEHRLKFGNDENHDEGQDQYREDHHHHRINQSPDDFGFQRLGAFFELRQTLQNQLQRPTGLTGLDHVDVQAIEYLGRFTHRFGKRRSPFNFIADIDQCIFQRTWFGLGFEDFQAPQDRQSRILQNGKLPGKGHHLFTAGATECKCLTAIFAGSIFFVGLLYRDLCDKVAHGADRGLRLILSLGINDIANFLTLRVHRFELKSWHCLNLSLNRPIRSIVSFRLVSNG